MSIFLVNFAYKKIRTFHFSSYNHRRTRFYWHLILATNVLLEHLVHSQLCLQEYWLGQKASPAPMWLDPLRTDAL